MIYCRVNDTDYEDRIVIEAVGYYPNGPAVPPWEEWSRPDLEGPFASHEEARKALEAEADRHDGIGIYFMPERDCPNFD